MRGVEFRSSMKVGFEFREGIIGELKKACVPDYGPVFGRTNGLALFGLNKDYQRKNWTEADTMAAQANVGRFLSGRTEAEQVDATAVLIEMGAAEEHKQGWKWFHRGWLFVSGLFGL